MMKNLFVLVSCLSLLLAVSSCDDGGSDSTTISLLDGVDRTIYIDNSDTEWPNSDNYDLIDDTIETSGTYNDTDGNNEVNVTLSGEPSNTIPLSGFIDALSPDNYVGDTSTLAASDGNANFYIFIAFNVENDAGEVSLRVPVASTYDVYYLAWSDRDVSITGTGYTSGDEDHNTTTYNLSLKEGWNIILEEETSCSADPQTYTLKEGGTESLYNWVGTMSSVSSVDSDARWYFLD